MRKSTAALVAMLLSVTSLFAQTGKEKVHVGLKTGLNLSTFRIPVTYSDFDPSWDKLGFVAGAFVDFPLVKRLHLQSEFLYSAMGSNVFTTEGDERQRFNYFSVPLFFKFRFAKSWNILGGVQGDVLFRGRRWLKDADVTTTVTDRTRDFDWGYTGGIETMFSPRVSFMARYIHGVHDVSIFRDVNTAYNQGVQATLNFKLGKLKKPTPPPVVIVPPADTDGDGIIDSLDKCPTVAGIAKYDGCPIPDTDKDGINDEQDKCPTVAGLAKYDGCPIPDTDKDGINDEVDKCPTVAGVEKYQGCPVPDTDNDGVNDDEDRCPNLPGTRENQGCPAIKEEVVKRINYAASNIYFATGKYTLLSKSNKGLNEVAKILNETPDVKLYIDGHTDDVGSDASNQTLSENRAGAVKKYLVSKGVDESRIISAGHGESEPIADNKTAAGRQKNRRVELKLSYY